VVYVADKQKSERRIESPHLEAEKWMDSGGEVLMPGRGREWNGVSDGSSGWGGSIALQLDSGRKFLGCCASNSDGL
jgi:glutamine amidotransferase-like uncharacterized protein